MGAHACQLIVYLYTRHNLRPSPISWWRPKRHVPTLEWQIQGDVQTFALAREPHSPTLTEIFFVGPDRSNVHCTSVVSA